jgi:hypothetical protein
MGPRTTKTPTLKSYDSEDYKDVESTIATRVAPIILRDGTSVEWPISWSQNARREWRRKFSLVKT